MPFGMLDMPRKHRLTDTSTKWRQLAGLALDRIKIAQDRPLTCIFPDNLGYTLRKSSDVSCSSL